MCAALEMEECQNRGDGAGMTIQTRRVYEGGRWRQRGGYEGWMEGWKDGRGLYCLFGWSIERRHSIIGTRWVHKARLSKRPSTRLLAPIDSRLLAAVYRSASHSTENLALRIPRLAFFTSY